MELRLNIPTRSADLTTRQLRFVSALFLRGLTETEFLVKAFLYISGMKLARLKPDVDGARWFKHSSLKKPFLIEADKLAAMARKVDFLIDTEELRPLPRIRFTRARHPRLYNTSFEEYLMAENYYFAFMETRQEQYLDCLVSVLYRYPWQRWKASKIQSRASKFAKVAPEVKNAVFLWYIGFRSYIPKRCKNLFSGKKSSRPFRPREYIQGMIHQLNNGDITQNDALLAKPVWEALDELEQRAIDYEMANQKH